MTFALIDLSTLEPSIHVLFSLAVALVVFNAVFGLIPASDDLVKGNPFLASVLPGIVAGWAVKSAFLIVTSLSRVDVAFQAGQLVLLAVVETIGLTVLYRSAPCREICKAASRCRKRTHY